MALSDTLATTTLKRKRPTRPQPTSQKSKLRAIECPICLDPTKPKQLITLDTCGCKYCKPCFQEAFTVGLTSTTYPARCCGRPLELTTVEKHVGAKIARAYGRKGEEVTTDLPLHRANSACGAFVGEGIDDQTMTIGEGGHHGENEQDQEKFLTCGKCHMKTCRFKECKKLYKAHLGVHAMCPDDVEDEGVRKLRRKKGWKRCPRCWALTEKTRGCDGIRCMCKAQWCYKCGKMQRGKDSCQCGQPDYVDLTDRQDGDAELPSLAEIFGFGEEEGGPVVESVEVGA